MIAFAYWVRRGHATAYCKLRIRDPAPCELLPNQNQNPGSSPGKESRDHHLYWNGGIQFSNKEILQIV